VTEVVVASDSSRLTKYHQGTSKDASILPVADFPPAMIRSEGHQIRIDAERTTSFAVKRDEPWRSLCWCRTTSKAPSGRDLISNLANGGSGSTLSVAAPCPFDDAMKAIGPSSAIIMKDDDDVQILCLL
jgi:hypothetical protein